MNAGDLKRVRPARERIDRDFAEPLNMPQLAHAAFKSVAHFQRSFKQAFGETPDARLMTRRVERAMASAHSSELLVTEVCMSAGGTPLRSVSARFTGLTGDTPSLPSPVALRVARPSELAGEQS